ncbi:CoA-binding protein [Gracilibacillus alcaliphilus]|uniref:CoA-binding protein n=1 Tax=Gracilibacillus alcaliphilus TaxID=1401441 RepID=UPI00195EDD00|nr:CoA-binding protein [Gracilibacillus alcaliphilus]MBM7676671.1 putative CoA-binding protein [Gracilibacillus alcaliphilus]
MNRDNQQQLMIEMLQDTKTIAVVGLSDKPYRTSYQIAQAMQTAGYRIIPVNPHVQEVLGEKAYDKVTDIDIPFEMINIFRRSVFLPALAEELIQTEARYIWMQQGVQDQQVYQYLTENGKQVIMNQCIKVAHAVLLR